MARPHHENDLLDGGNLRIKSLRKEMGLTQTEFGQMAGGISRSGVSQWEQEGGTRPERDALQNLEMNGDINPRYITHGEEPRFLPKDRTSLRIRELPIVNESGTVSVMGHRISNKAFAVRVTSRSMEPDIVRGMTAIVDPESHKTSAPVYVTPKDGEGTGVIRWLQQEGAVTMLVSSNSSFPPQSADGYDIVGRVVRAEIEF